MRKVPELRFDGFDEDWKDSKIQNIINVTSVKRVHKSDWATSGIPFLRARDLVSIINKTEVDEKLFISEELYNKYSKISGKVKQNDVLITGVGSIGVPYLVKNNKPLYFKDGNIIWFVNDNKLDGWFFYSQLLTSRIQDYIRASSGKGTVDTLTITTAKDINVIFPNNDEQEKIGLLFKKIDGLIEIQEGKVSKMEDFKKSMLQKMFPKKGELVPEFRFDGFDGKWNIERIGEIMKVTSVKRVMQSDWKNTGVPFLRARDLVAYAEGKEVEDKLYISEELYNKYSQISGKVNTGDLLVTGVGSIGIPYMVKNNEPLYFKDGNIIWLVNNNIMNGRFLFYSFNTSEIKNFIKRLSGKGTVNTLTISTAKSIPLTFPSIEEQAKIGQFFKNLDAQIDTEKKLLDSYKNMKKSLLQKMFV